MPAFVAAAATSIALLVFLAHGDPKRRRTAGLQEAPHESITRRILATMALLPGLVLALIGDAAALLMWLGSVTVAGWALALFLPKVSSHK